MDDPKTELQTSNYFFLGYNVKGWISKRVLQENKARQILRKTNISYPLIGTRTSGCKNARFSENLAGFILLKHSFWYSPLCLITDELEG